MIYNISFDKATTHFLNFKVVINAQKTNLLLQLPNWRPGRYQIQNFAKRIKNFQATDEKGNSIEVQKKSKSSWELSNLPGEVTISYQYFAFAMDAGNTWLDDEQVYINFINCCIYDPSQMDAACEVILDLPKNYKIASGLNSIGHDRLLAPSFYQLVDSPLFASDSLRKVVYQWASTTYNIWIQGNNPKSDEELVQDFKAFTKKQVEVMGEFPCPEYHFLIQCLPYKHYHGVEHWNSTVITIGPSSELADRKLYKELLGVSSHELFHTWNVIRLRPKEMTPYNFQTENYHTTGFVTEGVTTYYGDLFLARSGVFSLDEYLGELNKLLKRHYENEGRKAYSVAESSFDLWLDGYEKGIPGRKVSIYNEGALAALILDLTIRQKFNNKKSLDDIMRLMWQRHGQNMSGYDYNDYKAAAESIYEEDLDNYFKEIISGSAQYESYLANLFQKFGLSFKKCFSEKVEERHFGFRLNENIVTDIAPESKAEGLLSIGDKILSINGKKSTPILPELTKIVLTINRFGRELSIEINRDTKDHFSTFQVSVIKSMVAKQQQNITAWLEECIA
ncbi:M61 family metallopeptidase [Roseivirga sp.]|uniref:M61 family metallopeptidase n=1 Tax=Roseivirga sp. TaxID=1964215 RepID=UPI003B8ACA02